MGGDESGVLRPGEEFVSVDKSASASHAAGTGNEGDKQKSPTAPVSAPLPEEEQCLTFPGMNGFLAKAARQRIEEQFPDTFLASVDPPKGAGGKPQGRLKRVLWRKMGEAQRKIREEEVRVVRIKKTKQWGEKLQAQLGFRHVWKLLKSWKVPIVLHNGWFDLMFLFHYLEAPLPPTWEEVKSQFSERLLSKGVVIFDTKIPGGDVLVKKFSEQVPFSGLEMCATFVKDKWEEGTPNETGNKEEKEEEEEKASRPPPQLPMLKLHEVEVKVEEKTK